MRAPLRTILAASALAVCAYAGAQTIVSRDGSSVSITSSTNGSNTSITSSTSNSVSSSVDSSTGSTSSIVTNSGGGASIQSNIQGDASSCSIVRNGRRCEIACMLPEVAECSRGTNATRPSCVCKTQ